MIEIDALSFQYQGSATPALQDISLSIPEGIMLGITGAAGSGKSTLAHALSGIVPHCYSGDFFGAVRVDGLDTVDASLTDLSRVVGNVCQDIDAQMVASIVEDEILFGLENFGVPKDQIEARLAEALQIMGIADLRDRSIATLSGGQKQKVAIAAIIALQPRVLVLDEPTSKLDPASSFAVFELLRQLVRDRGTTVVVAEKKITLLAEYADALLVLERGQVRLEGTPEEVLSHSDELEAAGLACPRSTQLVNELRRSGLYGGAAVKSVEQACEVCKEVLA